MVFSWSCYFVVVVVVVVVAVVAVVVRAIFHGRLCTKINSLSVKLLKLIA